MLLVILLTLDIWHVSDDMEEIVRILVSLNTWTHFSGQWGDFWDHAHSTQLLGLPVVFHTQYTVTLQSKWTVWVWSNPYIHGTKLSTDVLQLDQHIFIKALALDRCISPSCPRSLGQRLLIYYFPNGQTIPGVGVESHKQNGNVCVCLGVSLLRLN
jgi:hypothetical protein